MKFSELVCVDAIIPELSSTHRDGAITELVEALAKAGADPDITDSMGVSARKYAALFHKTIMIELFNACAPEKEG